MAKKSLDEIFGKTTTTPQRKSLDDIFGKNKPMLSSEIPETKQKKSILQKFSDVSAKALNFGSKLINPTLNVLQEGIYQPAREVQKLIPGGKTGYEQIESPFGTMKDLRSLSPGESVSKSLDAAAFALPIEKVVTIPASYMGKLLGGVAKRIGGTLTGKGVDVIETVIKNPKLAQQGMRSDIVDTLTKLSSGVRDNLIGLSRAANKEYEMALEELPKRLGKLPKILTGQNKTTVSLGGEKMVLSKKGMKDYITEKLRDFGVKVNRKKEVLDFLESPFRRSEENILKEVFDVIEKWTDTTPKGINQLAVKVGNYRKAGDQSEALNAVIGGLKTNIRNYIGKRIPAVKELNTAFMQKEDFIDAIRSEFSVPNNLKTREGIIKVSRKIEQLFNSNKELSRELLKEFEAKTGSNILPIEAGRQLAAAPSRAQVSIGDSVRSLIQSVIPPKAIGEIAAYTGIASQKVKPFIDLLQTFAPEERQAIINLFSSFRSQSD